MRRSGKALLISTAAVVAALTVLAFRVHVSSGDSPPQVSPTAAYSWISGPPVCANTGPGWLVVPEGAAGQIFHVKNAHSCPMSSDTSVIPYANDPESGGKPFNLEIKWWFDKTNPDK